MFRDPKVVNTAKAWGMKRGRKEGRSHTICAIKDVCFCLQCKGSHWTGKQPNLTYVIRLFWLLYREWTIGTRTGGWETSRQLKSRPVIVATWLSEGRSEQMCSNGPGADLT